MMKFIHRFTFTVLLSFILGIYTSTNAQYIHLQMDVEPELSARVVQNLSFGNVIAGSGINRIERGSRNMGIFEIRGLSSQEVLVSLNPPPGLFHTDSDTNTQLPISLEAAYLNTGSENIESAQPFREGNEARFILQEGNGSTGMSSWQSAFIYIYGNINVGELPEGVYQGTLVLTVEYQ